MAAFIFKMCKQKEDRKKRDDVGKIINQDPLSKTKLSSEDLYKEMVDPEINAWSFFDREDYEF